MTDCTDIQILSDAEYLQRVVDKAREKGLPLAATFALTYHCNLGCRHCFQATGSFLDVVPVDLPTDDVFRILDEIAGIGCMSVVLTGGEPLIRDDFAAIYTHAKRCGLLTTVFTNGTLVDKTLADLFVELPPRAVEITVYGASQDTYRSVTGSPVAYDTCVRGIDLLVERNVTVKLKTVIMTLNHADYDDIEAMAVSRGLKFRHDGSITPKLNGDFDPVSLRVPPAEVVDRDFADPARAKAWRDFAARYISAPPVESLYVCGAGRTAFHVEPDGRMLPCMMVDSPSRELSAMSVADAWSELNQAMKAVSNEPDSACRECRLKVLCGYCPGAFRLETGSPSVRSEYLCHLGSLRQRKILS